MTQHTPGKWIVTQTRQIYNNHAQPYQIQTEEEDENGESRMIAILTDDWSAEQQANARLIAAAPELLDALISILNIEGAASLGGRNPAYDGLDVAYHFGKARAAILRATDNLY